ncbi:MAG TPA: hypothetical protein PLX65_01705 [Accumulibacter sp.]|nr:hypothetical protein [Accumulibacter sp.]
MRGGRQQLTANLEAALRGWHEEAVLTCFRFTLWFAERYASACELPSPIRLVLDNSLIQSFKHRRTDKKRAPHALAYEIFCGFVRHWSDRESHLAPSPMAIYEHIRRCLPASVAEVVSSGSKLIQAGD